MTLRHKPDGTSSVRRVPPAGTAGWLNLWASPANKRQLTPRQNAVPRNSRSTSWQSRVRVRSPRRFRPHSRCCSESSFVSMPKRSSLLVSLLFRRLGLPKGASLHSLRHSHGSHLVADGCRCRWCRNDWGTPQSGRRSMCTRTLCAAKTMTQSDAGTSFSAGEPRTGWKEKFSDDRRHPADTALRRTRHVPLFSRRIGVNSLRNDYGERAPGVKDYRPTACSGVS